MILSLSRNIILYSSLFITTAIGLPRLLLWRIEDSSLQLVPFNWYEWLIQFALNFLFCVVIFSYNSNKLTLFNRKWTVGSHGTLLISNLLALTVFAMGGGFISKLFIQSKIFPLNGNFVRLSFTSILILLELKILAAIGYAQQKEQENNQLRHANTRMELELLKSQLNPHFFFNALSTLSGVVREDQQKAQQYIFHLSKIFRYSLSKPVQQLVSLKEELDEVNSYCELMKMRHEDGFILQTIIDRAHYSLQLPQMSLQPIIENALKHNVVSKDQPLSISIQIADNMLEICNSIQRKKNKVQGTGIGLSNLNERYKILMRKEIEIIQTTDRFTVKLPLQ